MFNSFSFKSKQKIHLETQIYLKQVLIFKREGLVSNNLCLKCMVVIQLTLFQCRLPLLIMCTPYRILSILWEALVKIICLF